MRPLLLRPQMRRQGGGGERAEGVHVDLDQGLDQPAGGIRGSRTGAGEDHAEAVRAARVAVGHIGGAGFAAGVEGGPCRS